MTTDRSLSQVFRITIILIASLMTWRTSADPSVKVAAQTPTFTTINYDFTPDHVGAAPWGWRTYIGSLDTKHYTAVVVADCSPSGKRCVKIVSPPFVADNPQSGVTVVSRHLDAMPFRGQIIHFRAAVRLAASATQTGSPRLWLSVERAGNQFGFFDNMHNRPIVNHGWAYYDIVGPIAADALRIRFGIMVVGPAVTYWSEPTLSTVSANEAHALSDTINCQIAGSEDRMDDAAILDARPTIVKVSLHADVQPAGATTRGVVAFPIPAENATQVPLSFVVGCRPHSALLGYSLAPRPDGINWICKVSVAPPPKGCKISLDSLVLTRGEPSRPLLTMMLDGRSSTMTPEAARWLADTKCVQKDDPQIRSKALELAAGATTVSQYVRNVVGFTSTNRGVPGSVWTQLDAKQGLECGGSCTNCANLAAALLRAEGIPARTIAAMPTYFGGIPYYEHWVAQYWLKGAGWVTIEPTLGKTRVDCSKVAMLAVATPHDENMAFDPQHEKYVMPGAPYASSAELSPGLEGLSTDTTDAMNTSVPFASITGTPSQIAQLFARADRAFPSFEEHQSARKANKIAAIAATGNAVKLAAAISK